VQFDERAGERMLLQIDAMPAGDETEIGENGSNLSGGQVCV
jgi:ABC-type bacteriocin/lantibiotic exporter with double-glycine peptidase domain